MRYVCVAALTMLAAAVCAEDIGYTKSLAHGKPVRPGAAGRQGPGPLWVRRIAG